MDKSAIRNFAIEARKMLMKSAETEAGFYGVTQNGCKSPIQKGNDFEVYETIAGTENRIYGADIKRRANLVRAVETLGFEQVMEETAYTWFNRIIAIRFMEVNDYLPARVRVLSSETGSSTPDIVTQFLDVDLNMTSEELEKVQKAKDENRYDDAFRMLFIKQCNELNAILPGLFEKTDDYMELLLKLSYTSDGVVRMLVDSIDENNFNVETEGQVEIIGWMYQYYNTELKAEVFGRPSGAKIRKEDIPAATQLFTPDWIVRYMVENSVGRVWIDHLRAVDPSIEEKEKAEEFGWKYYLPEAEQEDSVAEKLVEIRKDYAGLEPKDITCIDPCMGSGHILVYMFDVLMDIYRSEGFSERDAVFSILENNIRGLDIDKRAYQLSYFALMMKARGYNRTFFRGKQDEEGNRHFVEPMVLAIEESNTINLGQLKYFGANLNEIEKNNAINQMQGLLESLRDAKEYGSILHITSYDWELLCTFIREYDIDGQISFDTFGIDETQNMLANLIKQGKVMDTKYWVVSTNPPYMAITNAQNKLSNYIKDNYNEAKADLFAVFIQRAKEMTLSNGYLSMITMQSWMFLTSFEEIREQVIRNGITNLLKIGFNSFPELNSQVAHACTFIILNHELDNYKGIYYDLNTGKVTDDKNEIFLKKKELGDCFIRSNNEFGLMPGHPLAFSLSNNFLKVFSQKKMSEYAMIITGMTTGKNAEFLRLWPEVDISKIALNCTKMVEIDLDERYWIPYSKGGDRRNWYGNTDYVVNWSRKEEFNRSKTTLQHLYLRKAITWPFINTDNFSARYLPNGYLWDVAGSPCFFDNEHLMKYALGFLCSKVANTILKVVNPTINVQAVDIEKLPLIIDEMRMDEVVTLVEENLMLARYEWNSYEMSWDFETHPLAKENGKIEEIYNKYNEDMIKAFDKLKENEYKLNQIFIEIYNISEDLSPDVEERYVTYRKPELQKCIKNLVSYIVGCMFGRYSINKKGIICAGKDLNLSWYNFPYPVSDGIIPITDSDYLEEDIVIRFTEFIKAIYGEEDLDANLEFIANVLGVRGTTTKDKIRNYFISDFYKEHCNMYSVTGSGKRPIYWLFDSGKQNGFKCLIYMHRYNKDTLNLIRSEYLHKTQNAVENALKNAEYIIQTSASAVERAKATKDKDKYVKQLNEMRIYNQTLSHLALQKIEIDLDDGVKHNYQLFQNIEVIVDGGKKQKVNLLAKI